MHAEHVDQLDPDEPNTPGWLTLLGLALFLGCGILFLVLGGDEEPPAPAAAAAEPDGDAAPSAP